ncbi:MAG TPA: RNA ligase family protein, partial [Candidatus Dojkabacteria bacterium]|nr:RNA ligase family protein [Candidatus Dojkabacteria bacterium]
VKNQYLNEETGGGFYGEDIWGVVKDEIKDLIPKGYTIYGEILGYTPSGAAIQKGYDYGCNQGEHKFYVYKISVVNKDGEVIYLSDPQIKEFCNKVDLNYSDTFIWYGKIEELLNSKSFLDWDINSRDIESDDWRELLLEYLEFTYNEKNCYMCVNNVPEEGIILRIDKLYEYEAYKLKSKRFLLAESDAQDNDETNIEDEQ